jgi:uncharacterized membrane protein YbhN (UPF0104 family)
MTSWAEKTWQCPQMAVPGGVGVVEAALTAALTSFGVPSAPAVAAVLVFRGITFLLPPVFGFFTLRWERAKGLV